MFYACVSCDRDDQDMELRLRWRALAMANIDTQKLMKFDELTSEQKEELKTRFLERKRELEAALKTVNGSLEALEKKP